MVGRGGILVVLGIVAVLLCALCFLPVVVALLVVVVLPVVVRVASDLDVVLVFVRLPVLEDEVWVDDVLEGADEEYNDVDVKMDDEFFEKDDELRDVGRELDGHDVVEELKEDVIE